MPPSETVAPCGICATLARIRRRESADLVAELPRSFLILGDQQFYRGYCILLAKRHVSELFLMPHGEAHELFDELLATARAINRVVAPLKLNYECLGNLEPHVHWHVLPRFASDPRCREPVWVRPEAERRVGLADGDRRELIEKVRAELGRVLPSAHW
ncbi:MAG TPA: HIT family protein [Candidatus Binataceae bacterium]|jgi:diadenosine tetraphosphate (Ap4A) HIT family hydrolase|nr:HIT family protein [Candidatus Binataceae bacterium]